MDDEEVEVGVGAQLLSTLPTRGHERHVVSVAGHWAAPEFLTLLHAHAAGDIIDNAIEALRISHRCIVMANGRVRLASDAASVLGMRELQSLYLGDVKEAEAPANAAAG